MDSSANLGHLKTGKWEQLQDIADRFEKAWQQVKAPADFPELKEYLPESADPLRPAALQELIKTDMEGRGRHGQPASLDTYLEKFPELGTAQTISPQLIYEEYRIRQMFGDKPKVESYQGRFPHRYDELQRIIKEQPLPTLATPVPTPSASSAAPATPSHVPIEQRGRSETAGTASSPTSPISGDFLSGYEFVRKIGSGGFGEVWEGKAPGGVPVAIKKIFRSVDHEESKREMESLELIKTLHHPFLLSTQAFNQREDRLFIVMELAEGSLRDRLKECRKAGQTGIPLAELITYFRESAEALDYLHSRHVLHRDIKPDNILTLEHHAKLADFGLARSHQSDRSVMASGSGTPAYMAPEVWRGKVCPGSDQYSLAMTYAELRLDRRLFQSKDMMEMMIDHLERQPVFSPLPELEQQVLFRAMAKDHNQRFANCREFIFALEQALSGVLGKTSPNISVAPLSADKKTVELAPGGKDTFMETLGREAFSSPASGGTTEAEQFGTLARLAPSEGQGWRPKTTDVLRPTRIEPRLRKKKGAPLAVSLLVFTLLAVVGAVGMALWKYQPTPPDPDPHKKNSGGTDQVFVPEGTEAVAGSKIEEIEGKKYYKEIDAVKEGFRVRFLLIPKSRIDDPPTFYIMRDKVHVGLFKKFADKRPMKDSDWRKGAVAAGKDMMNSNDKHPAMRMCVEDAYTFSRWLGGNLPTTKQWDKAAGWFEPGAGKGPFLGEWSSDLDKDKNQIAVVRYQEGPLEIGEATIDISIFGCRDMAGNGFEWTREVFSPVGAEHEVPLRKPDRLDRVLLRGNSYAGKPRPFMFDEQIKKLPDTKSYLEVGHDVGFRVVIDLP